MMDANAVGRLLGLSPVTWKDGWPLFGLPGNLKRTPRAGRPGTAQSFQWTETLTGELALLSLATQRYLRIDPATGTITADSPVPVPDGSDGVRLVWHTAGN
jgi:xylan 1,4-beta-xylosidase